MNKKLFNFNIDKSLHQDLLRTARMCGTTATVLCTRALSDFIDYIKKENSSFIKNNKLFNIPQVKDRSKKSDDILEPFFT